MKKRFPYLYNRLYHLSKLLQTFVIIIENEVVVKHSTIGLVVE